MEQRFPKRGTKTLTMKEEMGAPDFTRIRNCHPKVLLADARGQHRGLPLHADPQPRLVGWGRPRLPSGTACDRVQNTGAESSGPRRRHTQETGTERASQERSENTGALRPVTRKQK